MSSHCNVTYTDTSDTAKNGMLEAEKQALRATAKILKKAAREACPVDTGNLRKNIATWVRVKKKTGDVHLELGVYGKERAAKKGLEYAFYAHFVEFGHGGRAPAAAHSFLKTPVIQNIQKIRAEQAKYIPVMTATDEEIDFDEEVGANT